VRRGDDWAQTAHVQNYRQGTTTSGIRTDGGAGAVTRTGPGDSRTTVGRTQGGDVYAGRDGNVYRRNEGGGWEQSNGSGGWNPVDSAQAGQQTRDRAAQGGTQTRDRSTTGGATAGTTSSGWSGTPQGQQLEGDRGARTSGNQRTTDRSGWQSSGGTRSGAGSYRGGSGTRGGGGGGGRRR
jgi:hypothetical protein